MVGTLEQLWGDLEDKSKLGARKGGVVLNFTMLILIVCMCT